MFDKSINKNSELFISLTEQEQEAVSGGFPSIGDILDWDFIDILFNKTDIVSSAENDSKFSDGDVDIRNKSETEYKFSQINFRLTLIKYLFL